MLVKDFLTATKGIDYSRELFWQAPTKQLIPVAEVIVEAEPSSSTPVWIIALVSCAALAALAFVFQKKEH